jgi:thioredoxin 1
MSSSNVYSDERLIDTIAKWKRLLKSSRPVAVEFFSPTCPHCARLTPIFQRISEEYQDRMRFAMVNAVEQQGLAGGYGIRGVPTIKFFCDGRPVYEVVGFRPEAELRTEIERVLSTHSKCISQSSPLYV